MEVVIEVPMLLCRSFETYGACCSEQDQEHQRARRRRGGSWSPLWLRCGGWRWMSFGNFF
jgi:hypothetical protein